jgi:glycosyltransferase involved in cell wall biosynthesis
VPQRRYDGPVEVFHPRWLYPPYGTPFNIAALFKRIIWMVLFLRRTFDFDVLDAHFAYPDGVAVALVAHIVGRPFVITLRGNELIFGRQAVKRKCMRWALRRAAHVITVSNQLRDFAISLGVSPDRVTTVPNGVDTGIFRPLDRASCRATFQIREGVRAVVSAGGLWPRKNHQVSIHAVHVLRSRGIDAELFIAGGAGREPHRELVLRALVAELRMEANVHFVGHLKHDQLAELMNAADVFCLASITEGWPNVVHEALACGTPVVASRVGAVPELLATPDRGIHVPVNDVAATADALCEALSRNWDRASISAWAHSRAWDVVAAEVYGLLLTVSGLETARGRTAETRVRN